MHHMLELHSDFSTLTHLYYAKAYTLLQMNQIKSAQISAMKCLSDAISRGVISEYEIFYNLIEKNFNIDPISLFQICLVNKKLICLSSR